MTVPSTIDQSYSKTITVDESPEEAFAAITDVRSWWSAEIVGETQRVGDVFIFEVPDVHRCRVELTELVANERVVWHVSESRLSFIEDTTEWDGTDVVFDVREVGGKTQIRFTHVGLVPSGECFAICSDSWGSYITGSLRSLITTGVGDPHRKDSTFDTEMAKHRSNSETG